MSLKDTKDAFLLLCQHYSALGEMLSGLVQASSKDGRRLLRIVLKQFQETGEQLKIMGAELDGLGGDPVLTSPPGRNGPNVN